MDRPAIYSRRNDSSNTTPPAATLENNQTTKTMKKRVHYKKTSITLNQSVEGETIEQKIERIVNNKEPLKDGAPLIYTERKEGIRPSTNIRTDRFEIAIDGMDKVSKSFQARREDRAKLGENKDGGAEPIQGKTE